MVSIKRKKTDHAKLGLAARIPTAKIHLGAVSHTASCTPAEGALRMRTFLRHQALLLIVSLSSTLLLFGSVAVADESAEKSAPPPKDARVLFDGKDLSGWTRLDGKPAEGTVENGDMEGASGKSDIMTKEKVGTAFPLHVQ